MNATVFAGRTLAESTPWWPPRHAPPAGAPDVVVIAPQRRCQPASGGFVGLDRPHNFAGTELARANRLVEFTDLGAGLGGVC